MSVCLILRRSCCEGRVKAYIYRRSPSGIDHHGWLNVAIRISDPNCVGGGGGITVIMTQCGGVVGPPRHQFFFFTPVGNHIV